MQFNLRLKMWLFPLDEYLSPSTVNLSFLLIQPGRYITNGVCNEEREATLSHLRRFPRHLVLLVGPLPPVRHVAAAATVELLGNVIVTSWAATPIVRFGFHASPSFQICFACVIRSYHCGRQPRLSVRRFPHIVSPVAY